MKETIYDYKAKDIDGNDVDLSVYQDKVLLVVNVASGCGFTPQYEGLQKLYEKYGEQGFEVLGFPCNQFGEQEKGSESEIKGFCEAKYSISFPMFDQKLTFDLHLVRLECDDSWVEGEVLAAVKTLNGDTMPPAASDCPNCNYLRKRWEVSQKNPKDLID